jgi:hypothetical protein
MWHFINGPCTFFMSYRNSYAYNKQTIHLFSVSSTTAALRIRKMIQVVGVRK